jgi:hypothetical protein
MRRFGLLVFATALVASSGCSMRVLAEASSPEVGCRTDAIEISDAHGVGMFSSGASQTWIAECGEQRWFCSTLNKTVVCSDLPPGFELSEERRT